MNHSAWVKPETIGAIRRLGAFTRGRFDIWMLAGSHLAASRAIILSDLLGKRMPQSKAGVTVLREAFYSELEIAGDCLAHKEENFINACRVILLNSTK